MLVDRDFSFEHNQDIDISNFPIDNKVSSLRMGFFEIEEAARLFLSYSLSHGRPVGVRRASLEKELKEKRIYAHDDIYSLERAS